MNLQNPEEVTQYFYQFAAYQPSITRFPYIFYCIIFGHTFTWQWFCNIIYRGTRKINPCFSLTWIFEKNFFNHWSFQFPNLLLNSKSPLWHFFHTSDRIWKNVPGLNWPYISRHASPPPSSRFGAGCGEIHLCRKSSVHAPPCHHTWMTMRVTVSQINTSH